MRRGAIVVAVALAVVGIGFAVVPFARPGPGGTAFTPSALPTGSTYSSNSAYVLGSPLPRNCAAPILSSWQRDRFQGGWFGYAPLIAGQTFHPPAAPLCRPTARRHLTYAVLLWLAAAAVVWLLRRRPGATAVQIAPA